MSITKGHDEHGAPTVTFPMRPRTADAVGSGRKGGRVRPRSALGVRDLDADLLAQQATSELKMIKMKRAQQRAQPEGDEEDGGDEDEMPTITRTMTESERLKAEIMRQKQNIKAAVTSRRNTHRWNMATHSAHTEVVQGKAANAFAEGAMGKDRKKKKSVNKMAAHKRRASSSEMMASGSAVAAAEEEAEKVKTEREDAREAVREETMGRKAHEAILLHQSHHHADHHHITRMPTFSVKDSSGMAEAELSKVRMLHRIASQDAAERQEHEDEDDDGSASALASASISMSKGGNDNGDGDGDGGVLSAWDEAEVESQANSEQNAGVSFVPDTPAAPATPAHDSFHVRRQDTPSPFEHLIITPGQPAIVTSLTKDDELMIDDDRPADVHLQLVPRANEYYVSPPSTPGDESPAKKRNISFADHGSKPADEETSPKKKKTKEEKEREKEKNRKPHAYRQTITGGLINRSGSSKELRKAVSKQHHEAEEVEGKRRATMNIRFGGGGGGGGSATGDGGGGRKPLVTTRSDMPRVPLANNWREVAVLSQEKRAASNFSHHETAVAILEAAAILLDSTWRDLRQLALENFTEFYSNLTALDLTGADVDNVQLYSSTMATFKFQRVLSPAKDVPKCCRKIGAWLLVGPNSQLSTTLNPQPSTRNAQRPTPGSQLVRSRSTPHQLPLRTAGAGANLACVEWAVLAAVEPNQPQVGYFEARHGRGGHHAQDPNQELEQPEERLCADALTVDAQPLISRRPPRDRPGCGR